MDREDQSRAGIKVWVTPHLEQIEMIDTSNITGGCMNDDTGSKRMPGDENVSNNCSVGS